MVAAARLRDQATLVRLRTITLCVAFALALAAAGVGCKKKPPPAPPPAPAAVAEECRPLACSEKCPCGARQKCVAGVCGYDPAYHVRQIALGAGTFACALYANGEVWCAGKNVVGQLGNGKTPVGPSAVDEPPAKVVGLGSATEIAAGVFHACALVSGSVWCWGLDGSGELGAHVDLPGGVGQMTGTPVKVNRLDDAIEIAAGNSHACAIKKDRSVVCWGGHSGEGLTDKAGARPVKGIANARGLALNLQSSCAIRTDGTVACWGVDGPAVNEPGVKNAQDLARTQFSTCVSVGTGSLTSGVKCWGGRFGARSVEVPYLANTDLLHGGTDLVCGVTAGARELHCSDTKSNYRVTMGDSGVPVAARLIAVSGEWTTTVRFGGDVVDADDEHPSKPVIDMLGAGSLTPAEELGPQTDNPAVVHAVPSCDGRGLGGTCEEFTNGSGGDEAQSRCQDEKGKWSADAPCPREGAYGSCLIGSKLDHGATLIIYASRFTKSRDEARAMCQGGFDGTFTALGSP